MTGQAVKTVKSERKGRARIQAALLCFDRPLRRRAAGGLGASELRAGAMVDIGQLPVPMESALTCTALSAAAGSKPLLVTFSISASNAEATSSQVAMAGGALASSSCLPKTASFSSAVRAGSCHALFTDGRSVDSPYHLTWVAGSESHWTSFQALSRFLLVLKTTRSDPPTKEVAVFCFVNGSVPMFISGPWMMGAVEKVGGADFKAKYGVMPMPKQKTATSFVGGSD